MIWQNSLIDVPCNKGGIMKFIFRIIIRIVSVVFIMLLLTIPISVLLENINDKLRESNKENEIAEIETRKVSS